MFEIISGTDLSSSFLFSEREKEGDCQVFGWTVNRVLTVVNPVNRANRHVDPFRHDHNTFIKNYHWTSPLEIISVIGIDLTLFHVYIHYYRIGLIVENRTKGRTNERRREKNRERAGVDVRRWPPATDGISSPPPFPRQGAVEKWCAPSPPLPPD